MQCFTEEIAIIVKEKTLKLNTHGSYFKVYSKKLSFLRIV